MENSKNGAREESVTSPEPGVGDQSGGAKRVKIKRSNGEIQWVTRKELARLNAAKRTERELHQQWDKRFRQGLFLTAAAALIGFVLWLLSEPAWLFSAPPQTADTSAPPKPASVAAETRSVAAKPAGGAASAAIPGGHQLHDAVDITNSGPPVETAIQQRVSAWATAWSNQQVEQYMSFYSAGFRPSREESRDAWAQQRRLRLQGPGYIRVDIDDSHVTRIASDRVRVTFRQHYESDNYKDTVRKTLDLVNEEGVWRIVAERSVPL